MTRKQMVTELVNLIKEADNAVLSSLYEHVFDERVAEITDFHEDFNVKVQSSQK